MTKFNFDRTKTTTTIIASLVIGLLMAAPMTVLPNVNATIALPNVAPDSPNEIGCYKYTKATGWLTIPCISADELKKMPADIPTEGGGLYGVKGGSTTSTHPTYGQVNAHFTQYSGETDSGYGTSNTWSIQLNTNTYTGHDGHSHWIQFVEQNNPTGNLRNCVWQFDLSIPLSGTNPTKDCVAVSTQTLSSTFEGYVKGQVISGGSLKSTYCNANTGTCWAVVGTDHYDLGTYWTQNSGTILGMGSGSSANFVSTTQETTTISAGPETSANTFTSYDSGEFNNLSYSSSSTSCSSGSCFTTSASSN